MLIEEERIWRTVHAAERNFKLPVPNFLVSAEKVIGKDSASDLK